LATEDELMDANQAPDVSAWRVACAGTAFTALKLERFRLVRVLLVVYLASYLGLAVLCGFARQLAGVMVLGPLNLGYALIISDYVLAWVLALVYLRSSGRRHDALASAAIREYAAVALAGGLPLAP